MHVLREWYVYDNAEGAGGMCVVSNFSYIAFIMTCCMYRLKNNCRERISWRCWSDSVYMVHLVYFRDELNSEKLCTGCLTATLRSF